MITRIEIDGFKSFLDFKLDIPPFLALVGPNASGKSNLFDAVDYARKAVLGVEGGNLLYARRGRPHELFHRVAKGDPAASFEIVISARTASGQRPLKVRSHARPIPNDPKMRATETSFGDSFVEEVRSWRLHLPDPLAMRRAASTADTRALTENGDNLAAVLGRLSGTPAFDELTVDLVSLIPDVIRIETYMDERRQEWSFDVVVDGQGAVPSTVLSDGTLRVLGLLVALHDPEHSGVLMIEEIENGLHPSRLAELLRRVRQRVTDLDDPESLRRPLRQVIITSHSPVVVAELHSVSPESLVFMDTAVRVDPENDRVSRVTVAKPVREEGEPGTYVSPRQVRGYLSTVRRDEP